MEDRDNVMLILKSIAPIKYTYSKKNKLLNKSFKSMSLQNLMKNLKTHHKVKDEFYPSPEFLKNRNKFDINFKNSNAYIKELSDLNNLPLVAKNKNYIKNKSINSDLDNYWNNKEETKRIIEEREKRKKEILDIRLKKIKIFKKGDSDNDSLKYNPNYDFIKKRIIGVHIRPPHSFVNINKNVNENEKYNGKIKKISLINKNRNEKNINIQQLSKNQSVITLDKNKKEINNISINNNSIIYNESLTIRSSSSKIQSDNNNYYNQQNLSRNNMKLNGRLINLKSLSKNYENRNLLTNSDCYTVEINKSTNIEDISLVYHDKEKINNSNSMRNILSKSLKLPKIRRRLQKNNIKNKSKRNKDIKYSIYFKKMLGRNDNKPDEKISKNLISYSPNYEFFRPHIHSTIFRYKKDDENYKKYKIGQIIRSYKYSPDQYFVFEYKKNKPKKFDLSRERLKIIETLRKKFE